MSPSPDQPPAATSKQTRGLVPTATVDLGGGASVRLWPDTATLEQKGAGAGRPTLSLAAPTHVRMMSGTFRDHLEIAERNFELSHRRARRALLLIATGRLLAKRRVTLPDAEHGPRLGALTRFERAAVQTTLEPGELLLIWQHVDLRRELDSDVLGRGSARGSFVLTDRRPFLLFITEAGDIQQQALSVPAQETDGRLVFAEAAFKLPASLLTTVLPLCGKPRTEATTRAQRVLGVARRLWLSGHQGHARQLADALRQSGVASGAWMSLLLDLQNRTGRDETATLQALLDSVTRADPHELLAPGLGPEQLWRDWELREDVAERCLAFDASAASWAALRVRWGTALWKQRREALASPRSAETPELCRLDLAHAEWLLRLEAFDAATQVLSDVRRTLPPPSASELALPGRPVPPGVHDRQRLERAWMRARADVKSEQLAALLQQLRLAPLQVSVLRQLLAVADPGSARRIEAVLSLLCEAQPRTDGEWEDCALQPLPEGTLERQARAELTPESSALLTKLETLVARNEKPDFETLRQYCERVTQRGALLTRVVDRAATLLGLSHVEIYVSRGHNDVGLRAFDGTPRLLLVGGQHLDPDSRYAMDGVELSFAVAAELAHVRMGNRRVTPRDVLLGALGKTRQGMDVALLLLPVLSGLKLAKRVGVVTAKLSLPQISRAFKAARQLGVAVDPAAPQNASISTSFESRESREISTANEQVLEAQRLLQSGADRIGLLCCGELAAAFRAMVKTRNDYVRVASELERHGALQTIERLRAGHEEAFDDLSRRLALLVRFYLSDDYPLLLAATRGHPATDAKNGSDHSAKIAQ